MAGDRHGKHNTTNISFLVNSYDNNIITHTQKTRYAYKFENEEPFEKFVRNTH